MILDAQTKRQIQEFKRRLLWATVVIAIPIEVEGPGFDPFTQSPLDIASTAVSETGKAISGWLTQSVRARLSGPSLAELSVPYGGLNAAFELGDLKAFFRKTDEDAFQKLVDNANSYLVANGQTFRPFSLIHSDGVLGDDERVIFCRRHTPKVRAGGL